jgi:hypothetical protein
MGHDYVGTEHLVLGLLIEGEGIGAHVLAELGATEAVVRAELERLLVAGNQGESGPKSGPPVYRIGERVLVHDPDPPYRLWEGRLVTSDDPNDQISIPGRLEGEMVTADSRRIHPIPMPWTRDCRFCRAG